MIKLTRLNNHVVAINPDHIRWIDSNPDTTLFLLGGETVIVRETLDDLITRVVDFRRQVRAKHAFVGDEEGDASHIPIDVPTRRSSLPPRMPNSSRGDR